MQPMEVLALVRRGFTLATPEQVELVRSCLDVEAVGDEWVPRWALEAEIALAAAGYGADRIAALFANGRGAVLAELGALVKAGRRWRVLEPRGRWSPLPFDVRTKTRLDLALKQHRETCLTCAGAGACLDAEELAEEIDLLFPAERRRWRRSQQRPSETQPGSGPRRRRVSRAPDVH